MLSRSFALVIVSILHTSAVRGVSVSQWSALNKTTGGHLFAATPFSRPCYSQATTLGTFDSNQCAAVQAGYENEQVRIVNAAAYMNVEWETCQATSSQCLLDSNNPSDVAAFAPPRLCQQGSVPDFFINVQGPNDVIAALQFSKATNVPIVVKNTGHDYKGRSSAPGALSLWTHNLQEMTFHPKFVADGCSAKTSEPAVTYGAGVTNAQLFQFADDNNIILPGGACPTVGAAGGFLQGGGHSAFSNAWGLGVDRVIEFNVVTPDGRHLNASACQNSDLFFALRGGGGGTFGVVLSVTTKALPTITIPTLTVSFDDTDDNFRNFLTFVVANSLHYAETGWGGYITPRGGLYFANPLLSASAAEADMASMKTLVANLTGGLFNFTVEPSYLQWHNDLPADLTVPVGIPFITTSRLVPTNNFRTAQSQAELLDALIPVMDNTDFPLIFAVAPFLFKDDGMTSVTPAWRNSLWHVTASAFWTFNTTTSDKRGIYQNFTSTMDGLRAATPGGGAYQNEADVYEPDFSESFWGSNYERLVQIKQKYDPDHLLDCWQCVNWKGAQASRFSCYISGVTH